MELQKHKAEFDAAGVTIFAISYDSAESLMAFAADHGIEFPLLADEDSRVIREFGILNTMVRPEEIEYYGIPYPGTYLVDSDGLVSAKFFNREYQVRETMATVLRSGFHLAVDLSEMVHDEREGAGVRVTAELAATEVRPRQHADIYVTLELEEGLHVYGEPIPDGYVATRVSASGTEGLFLGEARFPATHPFKIEGLDDEFHAYDGRVEIVVPVISTSREAAPAAVDLEVSFQACTDQMCYLPRTEKLRVEFTTAPGVRRAEAASS